MIIHESDYLKPEKSLGLQELTQILVLNEVGKCRSISEAKNILRKMYCHMLKWCFIPNDRCLSWINTINDSITALYNGYLNNGIGSSHKITENDFRISYDKGLKDAQQESNKNKSTFAENLLNKYPDLMTLNGIINPNFIYNILYLYSKNNPPNYNLKELEQFKIGLQSCIKIIESLDQNFSNK